MLMEMFVRDRFLERRRIRVEGIVQGVGFRPFVYQLAERFAVAGWVLNNSMGVVIEVEGEPAALGEFTRALRYEAPPLAQITHVTSEFIPLTGEQDFRILQSQGDEPKRAWVSPDVSICEDCLCELRDSNDRRFGYPFINCTNCGPRFTIIRDLPYDRPYTTMAEFRMCEDCQREYDDPHNRRFHAQPNACPCCGPHIWLEAGAHPRFSTNAPMILTAADSFHVIKRAVSILQDGLVLAIKGLGGYHLAADAANSHAVERLRRHKKRKDKPFALMVRDVETVREICQLNSVEEQILTSRRRPIVLLRRRDGAEIAGEVAPKQKYLGVMLPYTPLQHLLFDVLIQNQPGAAPVLVMTSGNVSDEPIAYQDENARARLALLADAFLVHNREIQVPCDDSVTRVVNGKELLIRRARGYAPEPLHVPQPFRVPVLAVGGHLKNTLCLARDTDAFVSQHIGDLENYETLQAFTQGVEHFIKLFDIEPAIIAHDLHPEYLSTKYSLDGSNYAALPKFAVQHHHAHIASVMGEFGMTERVIGVAFDGTGYGTDGTIWGGEFLVADLKQFERAAHLDSIPLTGGAQAIHQVWRLAAAWLDKVYGDELFDLEIDFVKRLDRTKWRVMQQMAAQNINSPQSSAMGRLFDAVAALIGVREYANYEAQAAIELEMIADETITEKYGFDVTATPPHVLKMDTTIRSIVHDLQAGVGKNIIASKFHNTIANAVAHICAMIREDTELERVVLGGGVFQNALLLTRTMNELHPREFEVFVPTKLPPNDGAIAFGQALIANAQTTLNGAQ